MPNRALIAFAAAVLVILVATASPAWALRRSDYTVEVLVDGTPVSEYAARGRTYIEALKGREYSVRLTNHTGRRVAVALSVDGLNSIDARTTTALDARKWILDPWQSIVLTGWQTSQSTARRFYFTSEADSYGEWLGRAQNLGVIAAAFFREKRIEEPEVAPCDVSAGAEGRASAPSASGTKDLQKNVKAKREADEMAATGIGREVDHRVRSVSFEPEPTAAATLELRYEFRDALVRLGVLPPPAVAEDRLDRRERARGFEDSGFAPDPFRRR